MTDIIQAPSPAVGALVASFLASLTTNTRTAYASDLSHAAKWLGVESASDVAHRFLGGTSFEAAHLALTWRSAMVEAKLSNATINRRLAALRSLVKLGRRTGLCEWLLDVDSLKSRSYRDTSGPPRATYLAALARANTRDEAILRLLGDLGLRRSSVTDLDVSDFDAASRGLLVRLKGQRSEPIRKTLATPTARALSRWIAERGAEPGPMFPNDRGARMNPASIYNLCRRYGIKGPHRLRHGLGSMVAHVTKDPMAVRLMLDHSSVETAMIYVDRDRNEGARIAELVCAPEVERG